MMDFVRKYRQPLAVALGVIAIGVLFWFGLSRAERARQVFYSDFINEVRAGHVADIRITDAEFIADLRAGVSGNSRIRTQRLSGTDISPLLKEFEDKHIRYTAYQGWSEAYAAWALIFVVAGGLFFYILRLRQGAGTLIGFSNNGATLYKKAAPARVTFDDVAGVDESKAELVEIVDFLKQPEKYQRLGGRVPKGVLLVGPPGTGKTLLAKAVAGEAGVPFLSMSGSAFVEMFVGVGAARVRNLFKKARQKTPCIVFIDELDAIGKSRASDRRPTGSNDERDQTLNQLLVEMDGFDTATSIIVLAATNTPEVLDPALVRPGRFDRQVVVDRADLKGRKAILKIHARRINMAPNVDLDAVAARTPGMVGSDLANIVNEAAILGARRSAEQVCMADFEEAIDRVMLGLEKSRVMSQTIKERVAYHESGHALVAMTVKHADPVHRVSIIPRTIGALGHLLQLPTEDKYLMTQPEIEDQIAVMLGGRASEEIVYRGVVSTGASNDLERASALARQLVTRYGMSERLGLMTYGRSQSSRHMGDPGIEDRNYSECTAEIIDQESRRILDTTYSRVRGIMTERRDDLERITRELISRETLMHDELAGILANG